MRLHSIIFSLSVALWGCNNGKVLPSVQTNGHITLVDSVGLTDSLLTYSSEKRNGFYPIYYLGNLTDTIRLGQKPISMFRYGQKEYDETLYFPWPDSSNMKIIVDTSFDLSHTFHYSHYDVKHDKDIADSAKSFKAFALFVYNTFDSLLYVSDHNVLRYAVRQAKNKDGNWVNIETALEPFCGTGKRQIILEPHQIAVAKLLRYNGDTKTECRLKYSTRKFTIYSNSFWDYIDEKQLTDTLQNQY